MFSQCDRARQQSLDNTLSSDGIPKWPSGERHQTICNSRVGTVVPTQHCLQHVCGLQHLLEMPCLYDSLNRGSDNLCWLTWYQIMVVGNQLVHPCTPELARKMLT